MNKAYAEDKDLLRLMDHLVNPYRQSLKGITGFVPIPWDRYTTRNGLLYYTAVAGDTFRVVVPTHNDLCLHIMNDCHDAPTGGHRGREKTYFTRSRDFNWPRQYQIVRK